MCPLFLFTAPVGRNFETVAMADVVERVRALADRVAAGYGLDVFDVQYRREGPGLVLRIQLDRPGPAATAEGSVSIDDCARVSRALSALLDVEDAVPTAYTLEVSSPGLDRPLRTPEHFRAAIGSRVKLRTPGRKRFSGEVVTAGDTAVPIRSNDEELEIPYDEIVRGNLIWEG